MKKLFGGLDISWGKLIIFAVICGVYTGIMAMLPATEETSFRDIAISFEWWILFGIILIINSKSPLDSALKVFVFFLISQPLVYLVQVPFSSLGFELFRYYPGWFRWTLLTIPMAYIGHYLKRDKWWGLFILEPVMLFLGYHYVGFLGEAIHFFPNHLLSAVFCAVTMIIYPLYIFKDKKLRMISLAISLLILAAATVYCVTDRSSHAYSTDVLMSGGETAGIEFDDSYKASLADGKYGQVSITYIESIESYAVHAEFTATGQTQLILESPGGDRYVYDLTVERYSYHIERADGN